MTGPALDPRIIQNIQLMRQKKLDADIPAYLRDIEHVDPNQYGAGSGGLGATLKQAAGGLGRMAVQGIGNLASIPFGMAGAGYQAVTGKQPPALLQGNQGTAAADQMGLPQYASPGERILGAGVENGIAGAVMPGSGAATAVLGGAAGAAGQAAGEMGAGPMGQLAASAAVGMGIPVVATMGAAAIRAALTGSSTRREAARQSLALLQAGDPNAPVTLGQVAQTGGFFGGAGRLLDAGLRKVPGANMAFSGALEAQSQGLGQRTQGIASSIGPGGSPITVGRAVQRGIKNGFVPKFRATANRLFGAVDAYVPPESPVMPSTTAGLFAQQNELAASARPLSDHISSPFMQKWGEDLAQTMEANPKGVPFQVLKALRSRLGDMLSGAEMVTDVNLGDVKRLYGSLTDDMTRTVAEVGGPEGMKAWTRASNYWKAGTDRLENILQPLMDKRVPETAYNALMSGTKEGGTVLRSTMRSLRPEERRLVTSSVIGKMGMAEAGAQNAAGDVFSPDRFLKKWNDLSPVAKGALFDGLDPNASRDLDRLAKATQLVKDANKRMPNPAGTASNVAFFSILSGLGAVVAGGGAGSVKGAAGGLVAAAGAQQLAKRVFTNPKMIHWLVGTTTIPLGMLSKQLALLAKDSQKWDGEDKDLADQTVSTLGQVDWHQVQMAQALAESAARQSAP